MANTRTKKHTVILGATGSIGQQALEVIAAHPEMFSVHTLTARSNTDLLARQIKQFQPAHAVITDDSKFPALKQAAGQTSTQLHGGCQAMQELVQAPEVDIVLTAVVGFAGLRPTVKAIEHGKTIALANKETLVVAGELIMPLVRKHNAALYPVDSEHSAIFQILQGEQHEAVEKIFLTASGGPFRNKDINFLRQATKEQALKHPTWQMGAKITIDSATMMNKGLEVIEARWLFDLEPQQIDVIVHPQSVIHSMVQFIDGSLKAQMGYPDMRLPIRYAMGFPNRIKCRDKRFQFIDYPQLTFEKPDPEKFRNLKAAYWALQQGGNIPCIMNAANEVAVDAFLRDKIKFMEIAEVIEQTMASCNYNRVSTVEELTAYDKEARRLAGEVVRKVAG